MKAAGKFAGARAFTHSHMDIDNYSTGMTIYGDLSSVFRHCAAKMPPPLTSLMVFFLRGDARQNRNGNGAHLGCTSFVSNANIKWPGACRCEQSSWSVECVLRCVEACCPALLECACFLFVVLVLVLVGALRTRPFVV